MTRLASHQPLIARAPDVRAALSFTVDRRPRELAILLALVLLLAVVFLLSLVLGSTWVPVRRVFEALIGTSPSATVRVIVVETIRLPRSLTAVLAGASLGIAGLQMQTLFRNPLADPFALGISSGASLGVALVVLGAGYWRGGRVRRGDGLRGDALITAAAIAGAAAVLGLVLARVQPHREPDDGAHPRPHVRLRRVGRRHRARRRQPARAAAAMGAVGIRIVLAA